MTQRKPQGKAAARNGRRLFSRPGPVGAAKVTAFVGMMGGEEARLRVNRFLRRDMKAEGDE